MSPVPSLPTRERVRLAVVGAGQMGRRHAELIAAADSSSLVGISDVDGTRRPVADELGIPFYEDRARGGASGRTGAGGPPPASQPAHRSGARDHHERRDRQAGGRLDAVGAAET